MIACIGLQFIASGMRARRYAQLAELIVRQQTTTMNFDKFTLIVFLRLSSLL